MLRPMQFRPAVLVGVAAALACRTPAGPLPDLTTTAERSGYVKTGRYPEIERLCHDLARAYREVACDEIGRTLQDRPILALRAGDPTKPTILIQAGIHAGEIEGKDAGFAFLRDVLAGKVAPGALAALHFVFVPVMNPDGHERFGPNHRPNQRGPEEMGFRTNGVNLNLNRDYVKADSPEMRAVLRLFTRYDPVLLVDLHTTDGAKFEHDIAVMVAPSVPRPDELDEVAAGLSAAVNARLTEQGHLPLRFYPSFKDHDDPASGFDTGDPPPRFSTGYTGTRNRLGILVETHSWRTYQERATSTYRTLVAITERAVADGAAWAAACHRADQAIGQVFSKPVELLHAADDKQHHEIEFRGYAYERVPSDVSGATWTRYDETKPQIWKVPLYDHLVPVIVATPPKGGYIVDGGYAAAIAPLLELHGITYQRLRDEWSAVDVEAYHVSAVTFDPPYEGRTRAKLTGAWQPGQRTYAKGAIYVPADQTSGRLVLHLFEPASPDSLAQWGFFTRCSR